MAANTLTPWQDLATREFLTTVVLDTKNPILEVSPAHKKQLYAICMEMLNYDRLPNGAFITKGTTIAMEYGSKDYSKYPDEWAADERKANERIERITNPPRLTKTSPGGKSTYSKVREAVLSKDV